MERRTSTILIVCIVIGAFGVTIGIITMAKPESLNPIILFLANPSKTSHPTSNVWTWVSGTSEINQLGIYGKKGLAASSNFPGARDRSISWIDSNDTLWLFGGVGYNNLSGPGYLNDLWKFDGIYWTWVSGTHLLGEVGTYGTQGLPTAINIPGARCNSISWIDSNDNFWLFGGYGRDSVGDSGYLNDLWMFNTTTGWWTWVSGNNTINQNGTYGIKSVTATSNVPGSRRRSISWIDSNDTLWLFGGDGYNNESSGYLNDLWNFNGTHWTWVSGTHLIQQPGNYGMKGVPTAGNVPGARDRSISWIDSNDTLWLFGGWGYTNVSGGFLNDLWKFNITTLEWTWVSGNYTTNQLGNYSTKGVPTASTVPGARHYSFSWIDMNDNLWLFGGEGYNNVTGGSSFYLNDLWKFNTTTLEWTWMSGTHLLQQQGNYGSKGVAAANNIPGARYASITFTDSKNTLWLFGGYGYDSEGNDGYLNDLWKFH